MNKKNRDALERLASLDAEKVIIGSVIDDPTLMGWIDLTTSHFTLPAHREMWRAIQDLYDSGKEIDGLTVADKADGVDLAYVAAAWEDRALSGAIESWVEILDEKRKLRVLADSMAAAQRDLAQGSEESSAIHEQLLNRLISIEGAPDDSTTLAAAVRSEMARLEAIWSGASDITARLATGIEKFDYHLGGLPIGVPTILGARPGVGKSTFVWNVCRNQAAAGEHAIILSNEDRAAVMARLAIANRAEVARRRIMAGNQVSPYEQISIRDSIDEVIENSERIHVVRVHGKKMRQICREATALIRKTGANLVILDYVQNVPNPEPGMKRNYGIEENLTLWEDMIEREDIAGVIVSQLRRPKEVGMRPTLEDLKDSGSLEQKGKLIFALYIEKTKAAAPDELDRTVDKLEVCILKNSEGTAKGIINLHFAGAYGRLTSPPEQQSLDGDDFF